MALDSINLLESKAAHNPATTQKSMSFTLVLHQLVAKVLARLDSISQNDRKSAVTIKHEIKDSSLTHATLIGDNGRMNRNISLVSFAAQSAGLFLLKNADDKEIARLFSSSVIPAFGGMFTAGIQSNITEEQNRSQLLQTEYANKTQQQSNSNSKDGVMSLQKAIADMVVKASSGN